MTCIVGVVDEGKVYIGADSAGVGGWSLTIRRDAKVFRNGDIIIGGTSSFRMLDLLRYAFTSPVYDPSVELERYMATIFVNALRECFKAGGFSTKSQEAEAGGTFLIGLQGRLFHIEDDYQVGESASGYDAVGCGADVARGALFVSENIHPRIRVEQALRAAEQHNIGVRGPFVIEVLEKALPPAPAPPAPISAVTDAPTTSEATVAAA